MKYGNSKGNSHVGLIGGIALGAILIFGIIIGSMLITRVPAGYVGVVYNVRNGVSGEILTQGWHMTSPSKHVTLYTVGLEQSYLTADSTGDSKDDESYEGSSSEGKAVTLEAAFMYQFDQDRVSDVFTTFKGQSGTEIRDSFIKPNFMKWSKEVLANYKISDMLGERRAEINNAVQEYVAAKFEPYGIIISNAGISDFEVDEETAAAISEKINAQQKQETQKITNETNIAAAEAQKTIDITNAEAAAETAKIEAEAEAEVTRIQAEAEAEANKKVAASLTPELIEKIKYEQWDGKLPTVTGSGASIIDIQGDEE